MIIALSFEVICTPSFSLSENTFIYPGEDIVVVPSACIHPSFQCAATTHVDHHFCFSPMCTTAQAILLRFWSVQSTGFCVLCFLDPS